MKWIYLDFETYYSQEYSLRKMTPVEYVLDQRFEVIGCAVKQGLDGLPIWVKGADLPAFFATLDPANTAMVTHNALFDMCIVAWRYGFIPKLMVDTMGIARAVLGHVLKSVSLASVAAYLGLGSKGGTVTKVVGMNALAIEQAGLMAEYSSYSLNDVELCAGIFDKLVRGGMFPVSELAVMDMVLRCAIEPKFTLDANLLAEHLGQVRADKQLLLTQVMLTTGAGGKSDLMSNDKFAELLRLLGVDPPMKISLATGKQTYAFSKTDVEFLALEEHENPAVQALFAARLGYKSTLEETRTERLLTISQLEWPGRGQCALMPVPLRFSGAHTHRLSGDWKLNEQNNPRGGKIRHAHKATPGHKVITVDASQIEARLTAWLAGQQDLVDQFANKEDAYSNFASTVFGFRVNKKDHPQQRFVGKQAILGLGFGLGWIKFQARLKTDSKNQTGTMIELPDAEAQRVVNTYRSTFYKIPAAQKKLQYEGIPALASGAPFKFGPCIFEKQAILLPNGLKLHYHDLQQKDGEWWFTYGGKPKYLYGGKLLENIVQALDRCIVFDAAMRIQRRGYKLALNAHDENAYVIRDDQVDACRAVLLEEMERRPSWAPDLPLASEVGIGQSYGEAK